MFGLRQKLFFGFGGLLAILLSVSVLCVVVLQQHRSWLDRFLYENWRSVEYGQHMLDAIQPLNAIAQNVSGQIGEPTKAEITAAAAASTKPLVDFDTNCDAENHNLTLPHEQDIAADLTQLWSGFEIDAHTGQQANKVTSDNYRDAFAKLINDQTSLSDRRAALYASTREPGHGCAAIVIATFLPLAERLPAELRVPQEQRIVGQAARFQIV